MVQGEHLEAYILKDSRLGTILLMQYLHHLHIFVSVGTYLEIFSILFQLVQLRIPSLCVSGLDHMIVLKVLPPLLLDRWRIYSSYPFGSICVWRAYSLEQIRHHLMSWHIYEELLFRRERFLCLVLSIQSANLYLFCLSSDHFAIFQ